MSLSHNSAPALVFTGMWGIWIQEEGLAPSLLEMELSASTNHPLWQLQFALVV